MANHILTDDIPRCLLRSNTTILKQSQRMSKVPGVPLISTQKDLSPQGLYAGEALLHTYTSCLLFKRFNSPLYRCQSRKLEARNRPSSTYVFVKSVLAKFDRLLIRKLRDSLEHDLFCLSDTSGSHASIAISLPLCRMQTNTCAIFGTC